MNKGQKRYPKELVRQDFAELSGELSGAICLKTLVLLGSALNCLENSLVLFVRFFGFGVLFCPLNEHMQAFVAHYPSSRPFLGGCSHLRHHQLESIINGRGA